MRYTPQEIETWRIAAINQVLTHKNEVIENLNELIELLGKTNELEVQLNTLEEQLLIIQKQVFIETLSKEENLVTEFDKTQFNTLIEKLVINQERK